MNIKRVAYHFFKGVVRTAAGGMVTGVCYLSGLGFYRVLHDSGYMAVVDFVGAVAMLVVSVIGIYWLGGGASKKEANDG